MDTRSKLNVRSGNGDRKVLSVAASEALVEAYPQVITKLAKKYKTTSALAAMMIPNTFDYAEFYDELGLETPAVGIVYQAVSDALSGTGRCSSAQKAEAAEAMDYEVWIASRTKAVTKPGKKVEDVFHYKVDRKTSEVTEIPADLLSRQAQEYELERPGVTRFLGDLITIYDFSNEHMAMWSSETGYNQVKPTPYDYQQLQVFRLMHGPSLHVAPASGLTSFDIISDLVRRVGSLPLETYLEIMTAFYNTVFRWPFVKSSLPRGYPIKQMGLALVNGLPFFKYHAAANLPKTRINYYLYRSDQWEVVCVPPKTTKTSLVNLGNSRAHRRENKNGYSGYTAGHREGGHLSDTRVWVTRVLGLTLPYLREKKKIEIRMSNVEIVKHLNNYYVENKFAEFVKYVQSESVAIGLFGVSHYKKHSVEVRTPTVLFFDMDSTALPSIKSNTDADLVWEEHFLLPEAPYVAYRKVPPNATTVKDQFVHVMGSSHAFDFMVTSETNLSYAGRKVALVHGKVEHTDEIVKLERLTSPIALLNQQFIDDRRKLELFVSMPTLTNAPSYLNLWTPPQFFNKKTRHRIVTEVQLDGGEPTSLIAFDYDVADPVELEDDLPAPELVDVVPDDGTQILDFN